MSSILQSLTTAPGRFGPYGGRYVPETLMVPLFELERAYEIAKSDVSFQSQLQSLLKNFAGRPTPLQLASRLTAHLGGPRLYLKREDLLHTGAHKIPHWAPITVTFPTLSPLRRGKGAAEAATVGLSDAV